MKQFPLRLPSATTIAINNLSFLQDKEGFTLSEFILPEVARKINSTQGEGLVCNASSSEPQSTDSDIGLISQNDLLMEPGTEGVAALGRQSDQSADQQQGKLE
mgnify:FL=1